MKKIVPFKKDIIFKNDLEEITDISLNHFLKTKENFLLTGLFKINGTYKITKDSINEEQFENELPFEIRLDEKYEISNATLDIEDFYYEIVNNKILSVSIEVGIDNLLEIENQDEGRCIEEESIKSASVMEEYKSYKIYIVRENDTIETIMQKYDITKEALEEYNNLTNINVNDKIVIPCIDERAS